MPCLEGMPVWHHRVFEYFKEEPEIWIFKQRVLFFKTVCGPNTAGLLAGGLRLPGRSMCRG